MNPEVDAVLAALAKGTARVNGFQVLTLQACGMRDAQFSGPFPVQPIETRIAQLYPGQHYRVFDFTGDSTPWWAVTVAAREEGLLTPVPEPPEIALKAMFD